MLNMSLTWSNIRLPLLLLVQCMAPMLTIIDCPEKKSYHINGKYDTYLVWHRNQKTLRDEWGLGTCESTASLKNETQISNPQVEFPTHIPTAQPPKLCCTGWTHMPWHYPFEIVFRYNIFRDLMKASLVQWRKSKFIICMSLRVWIQAHESVSQH